MLELPHIVIILLGVILTPADTAPGQIVKTSPDTPSRLRQGINVDSELNNGFALSARIKYRYKQNHIAARNT